MWCICWGAGRGSVSVFVFGSWRPTLYRVFLRMSQQTVHSSAPAVMQVIPVPVLNSSRSWRMHFLPVPDAPASGLCDSRNSRRASIACNRKALSFSESFCCKPFLFSSAIRFFKPTMAHVEVKINPKQGKDGSMGARQRPNI